MKLGILLADLLIDSKNSLKIEDTNAATACLTMACRVEPESLIVLGSLLQLAKERWFRLRTVQVKLEQSQSRSLEIITRVTNLFAIIENISRSIQPRLNCGIILDFYLTRNIKNLLLSHVFVVPFISIRLIQSLGWTWHYYIFIMVNSSPLWTLSILHWHFHEIQWLLTCLDWS